MRNLHLWQLQSGPCHMMITHEFQPISPSAALLQPTVLALAHRAHSFYIKILFLETCLQGMYTSHTISIDKEHYPIRLLVAWVFRLCQHSSQVFQNNTNISIQQLLCFVCMYSIRTICNNVFKNVSKCFTLPNWTFL